MKQVCLKCSLFLVCSVFTSVVCGGEKPTVSSLAVAAGPVSIKRKSILKSPGMACSPSEGEEVYPWSKRKMVTFSLDAQNGTCPVSRYESEEDILYSDCDTEKDEPDDGDAPPLRTAPNSKVCLGDFATFALHRTQSGLLTEPPLGGEAFEELFADAQDNILMLTQLLLDFPKGSEQHARIYEAREALFAAAKK